MTVNTIYNAIKVNFIGNIVIINKKTIQITKCKVCIQNNLIYNFFGSE